MERIPKNKRKQRISTNIIIVAVILSLIITAVLYSTRDSRRSISTKITGFIDEVEGVYVVFDIKNEMKDEQICNFTLRLPNEDYKDTIRVPAQTTISHKILTNMPSGKTKFNLYHTCKNVN